MRDALSALSVEFRSSIRSWLDESGEVLVLARLNRAAGRKDWFLLREADDLDIVIARSRPSDCLTAFSGRHLTHRGRADDELLAVALNFVMSTEESVFGEIRADGPELADSFAAVPDDEEWVAEWFTERAGRPVAFGEYPPFLSTDPGVAVDGIVPNADGLVVRGIY